MVIVRGRPSARCISLPEQGILQKPHCRSLSSTEVSRPRLPFQVLFVDEHDNPATDGLNRKHFGLQLDGQGSVCADPHGVLGSDGAGGTCPDLPGQPEGGTTAPNILPADECEADLVIDSRTVGNSSVSVQSLDQQSKGKIPFRFHYSWPRTDLWMLIPGAIAGFPANYSIRKRQKLRWYWSLFSSILGAFILFVVGAWTFLDSVSVLPTWPFALLWALLGGILGISAAKLAIKLLTHDADHVSEPALPSTSEGRQ
jgi:hypothetical protein